MTDTVCLSVAPQKSELTAWFTMEDRAAPSAQREDNAMFHGGGGHLDPNLLPQRAVEHKGRKITRMSHLFKLNGFLCMTEKAAAVLRQFDLRSGGLYPLELFRSDGVTPIDGPFWALNFGAKKTAADTTARAGCGLAESDCRTSVRAGSLVDDFVTPRCVSPTRRRSRTRRASRRGSAAAGSAKTHPALARPSMVPIRTANAGQSSGSRTTIWPSPGRP
ncbi:hypothetical protein [Tabrizicola sp.]|uniref:hypothetical protein n=1 Tax=Tabrizicola sp. TaxID=2005166 RepID=UPI003F2F8D00